MSIFLTHDGVQYDIKSGNANDFHNNLPAIKADIKAMREIHLGEQKWFSRPQAWDIKEHFGQTTVTVYGGEMKEEKKEERRKKVESFDDILLGVALENRGGWLVTSGLNWNGVMAAQIDPKEGQDLSLYRPSRFNQHDSVPAVEQITSLEQIGIHDIQKKPTLTSGGYQDHILYTVGTGKVLKTYTGRNDGVIDWHSDGGTWIHEGINAVYLRPYAEDLEEGNTGNAAAVVRNQEGYQDDETYLLLYNRYTVTRVYTRIPYMVHDTIEQTLYAETPDGVVFALDTNIFKDSFGPDYDPSPPTWHSPSCGIYNYHGRPVYVFSWSVTDDPSEESVPEFYRLGAIYQNKLVISDWFEGNHEIVSIFDSANVYGKYSNGVSFAAQLKTIF